MSIDAALAEKPLDSFGFSEKTLGQLRNLGAANLLDAAFLYTLYKERGEDNKALRKHLSKRFLREYEKVIPQGRMRERIEGHIRNAKLKGWMTCLISDALFCYQLPPGSCNDIPSPVREKLAGCLMAAMEGGYEVEFVSACRLNEKSMPTKPFTSAIQDMYQYHLKGQIAADMYELDLFTFTKFTYNLLRYIGQAALRYMKVTGKHFNERRLELISHMKNPDCEKVPLFAAYSRNKPFREVSPVILKDSRDLSPAPDLPLPWDVRLLRQAGVAAADIPGTLSGPLDLPSAELRQVILLQAVADAGQSDGERLLASYLSDPAGPEGERLACILRANRAAVEVFRQGIPFGSPYAVSYFRHAPDRIVDSLPCYKLGLKSRELPGSIRAMGWRTVGDIRHSLFTARLDYRLAAVNPEYLFGLKSYLRLLGLAPTEP